MGIAVGYASVPPAAIDRARLDPDLWDTLHGSPGRAEGSGHAVCCSTLWDTVWYLVDPARRASAREPGSLLGRAVMGAERIADPRGEPASLPTYEGLRVVAPDEARRAAEAMAPMAETDLWAHYDPAWLGPGERARLADRAWWDRQAARFEAVGERRWAGYHLGTPDTAWELFSEIREVYRDAAARGHAVTVCWM